MSGLLTFNLFRFPHESLVKYIFQNYAVLYFREYSFLLSYFCKERRKHILDTYIFRCNITATLEVLFVGGSDKTAAALSPDIPRGGGSDLRSLFAQKFAIGNSGEIFLETVGKFVGKSGEMFLETAGKYFWK